MGNLECCRTEALEPSASDNVGGFDLDVGSEAKVPGTIRIFTKGQRVNQLSMATESTWDEIRRRAHRPSISLAGLTENSKMTAVPTMNKPSPMIFSIVRPDFQKGIDRSENDGEKFKKSIKLGPTVLENGNTYRGLAMLEKKMESFIPHGYGEMITTAGELYEGYWDKGKRHGAGRLFTIDGRVFQGSFQNGLKNGVGILYISNTQQLEGVWANGKLEGPAVWINGDQKHHQFWENGKLVENGEK